MFRAIGTVGLGAVFIAISPALRVKIADDVDGLQRTIFAYSPWSYVFIGIGILAFLMFGLYRASQPRT